MGWVVVMKADMKTNLLRRIEAEIEKARSEYLARLALHSAHVQAYSLHTLRKALRLD